MGLRFGFGLPGPFSWSTNVFPRMPRGRIIRTSTPRSCHQCGDHAPAEPGTETGPPGVGFFVFMFGLLVSAGLASISPGLFFVGFLVSAWAGGYAAHRRDEKAAGARLINYTAVEADEPASRGPHDWPDSPARYSNRR